MEKIQKVRQLSRDIFLVTVQSERIAHIARAGQFVNIKCPDGPDTYLRRPISICSADRKKNTFDIAYQVRGKGTRLLSTLKRGDEVDVMGPLGRGFTISPACRRIIAVGGGIGIFPLLQLLKEHPAKKKTAILGFRTRELIVLEDEFGKYCDDLIIATDDGSYGQKGFVTSILGKETQKEPADMVYFCGPSAMMRIGVSILKEQNIPCEVSMEQRMGCGVGACLVCACRTRNGNDWDYSRVCKDGPVFNGYDVLFDES